MKLVIGILLLGISSQGFAQCTDFTGTYKCEGGSVLVLKQTDCTLLEITETNPQGQSFEIVWNTDGVAHYYEPGSDFRNIWTAYHSDDGIHHFVGSHDSYEKKTTTYRRHLSVDKAGNLSVYYLKARDGVTLREHTNICAR